MSAQIIRGVHLLELQEHGDSRGGLVVLEDNALPFVPGRIFFMTVPDAGIVRGEHAGTSEQLIIAASGSVSIDLDNGEEQATIRLAENNKALWVRPGIWLRLREFKPGTVLLVAASRLYADTLHFEQPQYFE
jgi:dTDP-4-dehydrorhamnose 3,5-epimerase-like enzyme